jgi:hypothetical protein
VREMAGDVGACDAAGGARGWSEEPPPLDAVTDGRDVGVRGGSHGASAETAVIPRCRD